jgi:hypothetical protein
MTVPSGSTTTWLPIVNWFALLLIRARGSQVRPPSVLRARYGKPRNANELSCDGKPLLWPGL